MLTTNEFAELSLTYLLKYTRNNVTNFEQFCLYLNDTIIPFIDDVSIDNASYWHLEAQSCGSIDISSANLPAIWKDNYLGVLGGGISKEEISSIVPEEKLKVIENYMMPCFHDATKLQPNYLSSDVFYEEAKASNLTSEELEGVWSKFAATFPTNDMLIDLIAPNVSRIKELFDLWNSTPLKNLKLNSVGITIGHANAKRVVGFDAPLDAWIK